MKKVAIWAPLRYANVGDDMQAIAFAKHINSLGYSVKLFQLDESLSQLYNLESTTDVDSLCKDVNLCIIAGGALLTPFRWFRRLVDPQARAYENDFKDLLSISQKYPQLKFCAISMGGDGHVKESKKWYSRWRIDFFRSSAFLNGTVRLEGDVVQMKQAFGKDFEYHADMLLRTQDFFEPVLLKPNKKKRVCFQLKKRHLDSKLIEEVLEYAELHDDIEFRFITTHMPKVGLTYQYLPKRESKNVIIDTYQTPNQLLGVIASCDVLITSMLHVGLIGLTFGVPFVSYRGPEKSKSFLKTIEGEWAILPDNISFKNLYDNILCISKTDLWALYNQDSIKEMSEDSKAQYDFCSKIVETYA